MRIPALFSIYSVFMKSILAVILSMVALVHLRGQEPPSLRERHNFNREWKFQLGDHANAEIIGGSTTEQAAVSGHNVNSDFVASRNSNLWCRP
jgi:hypothetical protein